MIEKINFRNEEGRINDPEIAEEMAKTEDSFHKKTLGVFPASKKKILEGEKAAEKLGIELFLKKEEERLREKIENISITRTGASGGDQITMIIDGHQLEIDGHLFTSSRSGNLISMNISSSKLDGKEISLMGAKQVFDLYFKFIKDVFEKNKDEQKASSKKEISEIV